MDNVSNDLLVVRVYLVWNENIELYKRLSGPAVVCVEFEVIIDYNREFILQTQNHFETLDERDIGESNIFPSEGITRHRFEHSTMVSKLMHTFDELRFIRNAQVNCNCSLSTCHQNRKCINERLNKVNEITNSHTELMNIISYKFIL